MTATPPRTPAADALAAAVYEGASDPILVVSTEGVVLDANAAARAVLGDGIVGDTFGVALAAGSTGEVDLHIEGGSRVVEPRTGRARLEGRSVFVVTLRDVTDRARAEQSLRDFVSTASHEFRTPLSAIQGFAETLELQWDHLTDEDRRRYLGTIHRHAQRLARLTDDLLTVTRIDGGAAATAIQPTRCADAVVRALELVGIDVRVDVPPDLEVLVDPDDLEDVLVNLLTNAVKYGAPPFEVGGHLDGDHGVLLITDHGDGVPSAFRGRMFDRFSRGAARDQPGTGLGLPIVQGLLRRNGGELSYEGTPGRGATFVVRLPRVVQ